MWFELELAKIVKKVVEREFPEKNNIEIVTTPSDDNRSYHINSDKIKKTLNYAPKFSIDDAIKELCDAFKENKIKNSFDDDKYYNVKRLKRLQARWKKN